MRLGLNSSGPLFRATHRFSLALAVAANTDELVVVLNQFKAMFRGELSLKDFEGFKLKLDDFFADLADQVVMMLMAENGLIAMLFPRENSGLHQACFAQKRDRSIDCRARRGSSFSAAGPEQD